MCLRARAKSRRKSSRKNLKNFFPFSLLSSPRRRKRRSSSSLSPFQCREYWVLSTEYSIPSLSSRPLCPSFFLFPSNHATFLANSFILQHSFDAFHLALDHFTHHSRSHRSIASGASLCPFFLLPHCPARSECNRFFLACTLVLPLHVRRNVTTKCINTVNPCRCPNAPKCNTALSRCTCRVTEVEVDTEVAWKWVAVDMVVKWKWVVDIAEGRRHTHTLTHIARATLKCKYTHVLCEAWAQLGGYNYLCDALGMRKAGMRMCVSYLPGAWCSALDDVDTCCTGTSIWFSWLAVCLLSLDAAK